MSSPDPAKRPGDPHVAMLLTWFVPGAGHLYLGKVRIAALAFVVIQGLYALGFFLSEGLFLNVLPPELRGRFAGVLAPEVGNLGALLLHLSKVGFLEERDAKGLDKHPPRNVSVRMHSYNMKSFFSSCVDRYCELAKIPRSLLQSTQRPQSSVK